MRTRIALVLMAAALTLTYDLSDSVPAAHAMAAATTRVNVSSSGAQANGYSSNPLISSNGQKVVFDSAASNLVANDTNGTNDVFLRDLATASTTRISVSSSGEQAIGTSGASSISPDGRYVVFSSSAANLVPGDTNGFYDLFLRDTMLNTTIRVSVGSSGEQANGASASGRVSQDGRIVALRSEASNLVPGDTNGGADLFIRDTQTNQTTRVMGHLGQEPEPAGWGQPTAITPDGRYIVHTSEAQNLVEADLPGNHNADVFVYDRLTSVHEMVSVTTSEIQDWDLPDGEGDASDDGRLVFFGADGILDESIDPRAPLADQLYIRDRWSGTTALGSRPHNPAALPDCKIEEAPYPQNLQLMQCNKVGSMTGDGRYLVFRSRAVNMADGDTNTCAGITLPGTCDDVFIRDTALGRTARVSLAADGNQSNGASEASPQGQGLSDDGRHVVFSSLATNLVPSDTNGVQDIFVRDNCWVQPGSIFTDVDGDGRADELCDIDDDGDGFTDAYETFRESLEANPGSTPEVCDALDNDADGTVDEAPPSGSWDVNSNLVPDCFDTAVDTDGDTLSNLSDLDDDGDGLSDSVELHLSTDSLDRCPNNASHDAWPADFDRNKIVTISDLLALKPSFGSSLGDNRFDRRADLVPSNSINIADLLAEKPRFGTSCT